MFLIQIRTVKTTGLRLAVVVSALMIFFIASIQLVIKDVLAHEEAHSTKERIALWQELLINKTMRTDQEKLRRTNRLINETATFAKDSITWGMNDYWATPLEFITRGAGDCEDFAIAKYFTLRELGVPDRKMRLTYVKAIDLNQAHMVLTYYDTPGSIPLVLDNLIPEIKPASMRTDLVPVYSFNGAGLWLAKTRGLGKQVGKSNRVGLWQELRQRMLIQQPSRSNPHAQKTTD